VTDEESFLAAIKAAPADDAPRLVYADWLDEQGRQDYAAFIRIEERLRNEKRWVARIGSDIDLDWLWVARVYPNYRLILNKFENEKFFGIVFWFRKLTGMGIHETMDFVRTSPCVISAPVPIDQLFSVYQELNGPGVEVEFQFVPRSS